MTTAVRMRAVLVTPQFAKDLRKIPRDIQAAADTIVQQLATNPLHPDFKIKKLRNIAPAVYRVRIGHYRLIFSYTSETVVLHRIRHRKDIYRIL